ncbi:MAG: glycosyltransferase family 4 protein [Pseudomonadota bacterium]
MRDKPGQTDNPLKIVHCFRSPVGGIFRHVRDLIDEQTAAGHEVGVVCDDNTGGAFEEALFQQLQPKLALGLHRVSMDRAIGLRDISVILSLFRMIRALNADVLHSHGAKGGAYARIIGTLLRMKSKRPARLYCPHGGSVHYDKSKPSGFVFFQLERLLERVTDRLIFVSEYERDSYFDKVGKTRCPHSLVFNGVTDDEFTTVETDGDAADFLYVGMMRDLKGVDLFLKALPLVARKLGRPVSAVLVGDGPDLESYKALASSFDGQVEIEFRDPMPARDAFGLGRALVVPSRAESMPYIVLEALAAKRPLLATRVGGIPEIYGPFASCLVEPDDLEALSRAMSGAASQMRAMPNEDELQARIRARFSTQVMAESVMEAYRATLAD